MALTLRANSGGAGDGEYELPPPGTYKAVLVGIYDLGTQEGGQFAPKHQVLFNWELFRGGKPLTDARGNILSVSKFYTLSLNEKATLRGTVETLLGCALKDGDEFNLESLLGSGCRLQLVSYVKQNGQQGVKIKGIIALDEGESPPETDAEPVLFEISGSHCHIPPTVPGWVATIVQKSPEWQGTIVSAGNAPRRNESVNNTEDIPF